MIMYILSTRMPFPRWYLQTIVRFFFTWWWRESQSFQWNNCQASERADFQWLENNAKLSFVLQSWIRLCFVCLLACSLINEICLTKFWQNGLCFFVFEETCFPAIQVAYMILQNFIHVEVVEFIQAWNPPGLPPITKECALKNRGVCWKSSRSFLKRGSCLGVLPLVN